MVTRILEKSRPLLGVGTGADIGWLMNETTGLQQKGGHEVRAGSRNRACGGSRGTLLLLKWGLPQMPCLVPKLLRLMGSRAEHPVIGSPHMLSPQSRHSLAFLAKCPCAGDPLPLSCPPPRLMPQRSGGWGWGLVFHRFQRSHELYLIAVSLLQAFTKGWFSMLPPLTSLYPLAG